MPRRRAITTLACWKRALRLDEGNAQRAQFILASALEAIDPARVQDRDLVRMYLANALLELRRFDDAYQLYLDAVGLDPANYFGVYPGFATKIRQKFISLLLWKPLSHTIERCPTECGQSVG